MAPKQRKKTIPTNKTPEEDIPPPPPIKDDTSDYNSSSDSESDISEVTPPPPPLPPPKPIAPHPPLKQQTLMSSYSGSYKATILRLLREDPQVQEVLAETILRITGNGGNPTTPSDGDLRNRILRLLQEDAQLRDAILGILPKPRSRTSKPKTTAPNTQPHPQPQTSMPADETNLPFEKRTLAFLRANAHTALTYEEFAEQAEITDADLECILQKGFVEGFSTLIHRNLTNLELSQRSVLSFARDHSAVYVKIGPLS